MHSGIAKVWHDILMMRHLVYFVILLCSNFTQGHTNNNISTHHKDKCFCFCNIYPCFSVKKSQCGGNAIDNYVCGFYSDIRQLSLWECHIKLPLTQQLEAMIYQRVLM